MAATPQRGDEAGGRTGAKSDRSGSHFRPPTASEKRLWELLQEATGAPDDQIVIGIQEVPPSQAMEMGQIMPDVAGQ